MARLLLLIGLVASSVSLLALRQFDVSAASGGYRWIPATPQPWAATPREDATDLVRRANQALGLPNGKRLQPGEVRKSTDGRVWLRVDEPTFQQLQRDANTLTPDELKTARTTPPPGDAPGGDLSPVLPLAGVKQVTIHLGDSITYGVSMGSTRLLDTWSGQVLNNPPRLVMPETITRNSLEQGYLRTVADTQRQAFIYGIPSGQLVNARPEKAGNPGPLTLKFSPADVNVVDNVLMMPKTTGLAAGKWVQFTTTGTLPRPLQPGKAYYVGRPQGKNVQLFTSVRDALTNQRQVVLLTPGEGTHQLAIPTPSWLPMLDRYLRNIRVAPGQQLVWVVFLGTNDVRYNMKTPITGPDSIATDHLEPFMHTLRGRYPQKSSRVLFVTPLARTGSQTLNHRLVEFRDYVKAHRQQLGIDALVDPATLQVDGLPVLNPATPGVAAMVRLPADGVDPQANTLTPVAKWGDPLWPESLTGLPVRVWPGKGNRSTLPAPLKAGTTYYVGAIRGDHFKLFPTPAAARAGRGEVDLTSRGTNDGPARGNAHVIGSIYYATDGTHPLVAGQQLLGREIRQALNAMLLQGK